MDTNDLKNLPKKNKIALYVDRNKIPSETPEGYEWNIVSNYENFTSFITSFYREYKKMPDLISLDHDLTDEYLTWYFMHPGERIVDYSGFETKSGFHCAVWLINACEKNKVSLENTLFAIHSENESGASVIHEYLNKYKEEQYGLGKANTFYNKWPFIYRNDKNENRNEKSNIPDNLKQYPYTPDESYSSSAIKKDV